MKKCDKNGILGNTCEVYRNAKKCVLTHNGIRNFTIIAISRIGEGRDFALFRLLRDAFEKRGALSI